MSRLTVMEYGLRKAHNLPSNFAFYKFQLHIHKVTGADLYTELTGAECQPLKSGPRRGKPNYKTAVNERTWFVTPELEAEFTKLYATETGLCPDCEGRGRQLVSWMIGQEKQHKSCPTCKGTGKAMKPKQD